MMKKTQTKVLDDYERFKKLLEYFVAYLEYCHHNTKAHPYQNTNTKGFAEYIQNQLPDKISWSGQGWSNRNSIQKPLRLWDTYHNYKIVIAADARNYTTARNYLTWNTTSYNIIAKWDDGNIIALTQVSQDLPDGYVTGTESLYKDV